MNIMFPSNTPLWEDYFAMAIVSFIFMIETSMHMKHVKINEGLQQLVLSSKMLKILILLHCLKISVSHGHNKTQ